MKKFALQAMLTFGVAGTALASGTAEGGGGGILIALFLGFVAVIVVFQLLPSLVVFVSVIRELFAPRRDRAPEIVERDETS